VIISLETIYKYGKNLLEQYACKEDFKLILDSITQTSKDKLIKPLDESQLSSNQGEIYQFEKNYEKYLPQ